MSTIICSFRKIWVFNRVKITGEEETGYIAEFFYFVFFMTLIHFVFNCIFKIALTVQESKTLKGCLVVLG